jgi:hypothetical protein
MMPAIDDRLMIDPPPLATMAGIAYLMPKNMPVALRRCVDAACARALVLGTRSYTSVAAILKNRRERAPSTAAELPLLIHENIRGPDYYH